MGRGNSPGKPSRPREANPSGPRPPDTKNGDYRVNRFN